MYIKYLCSCYMNVRYLASKCTHTSTSDRFMLYTSHPTWSMPVHKDTHGCLGTFVKTYLVKHFGNLGIRHRGAYQKDEFTTGPAVGKMETPETCNRIYWGSHMQHISTIQLG